MKTILFLLLITSSVFTQADSVDKCNPYKAFANEAMTIRQTDAPIDEFIEHVKEMVTKRGLPKHVQTNLFNIVVNAYTYPYVEDLEVAATLVIEYSNLIHDTCVNQTTSFK